MFSPTRTALYLAIGALPFVAGEAAAQTCRVGATKNCVTSLSGAKTCWCSGSEICAVSLTQSILDSIPGPLQYVPVADITATCTVLGSSTSVGGGEGSCPISGTTPSGTLTCDGGEGGDFAPAVFTTASPGSGGTGGFSTTSFSLSTAPSPADCALPGSGHIFGFNGVNVSGGSAVGTVDADNGVVCSNAAVAVSGINTVVNGNAVAGGAVNVSAGGYVTGSTSASQVPLAFQPTVTPCGTNSPNAGITPSSAYNAATGALRQLVGGTVKLDPGTYCFQSVTLSAASTLEISGSTTINVKGPVNFSGGSSVFNKSTDASLTINSSVNNLGTTADVTFAGGTGLQLSVYAPRANIKISTGATYSGSFIGKTVTINGASVVNNDAPATFYDADGYPVPDPVFSAEAGFTCDVNGICTAVAEVLPPPGLFCADGSDVIDFNASAFVGKVDLCFDGGEGIVCDDPLYQLCQQTNSPNGPYQCTDVTAACGVPPPPG